MNAIKFVSLFDKIISRMENDLSISLHDSCEYYGADYSTFCSQCSHDQKAEINAFRKFKRETGTRFMNKSVAALHDCFSRSDSPYMNDENSDDYESLMREQSRIINQTDY